MALPSQKLCRAMRETGNPRHNNPDISTSGHRQGDRSGGDGFGKQAARAAPSKRSAWPAGEWPAIVHWQSIGQEHMARTFNPDLTGAELRRRRIDAGLSQRALARMAGLHHSSVAHLEGKARIDPRGGGIRLIARALGWRIMADHYTRARHGVLSPPDEMALLGRLPPWMVRALTRHLPPKRVRCGARTRNGTPCKALSEPGRRRCKFHGGKSTGPRTDEGRAKVAEAQRRRWGARSNAT